jgi:uncharacterized RDD family membrane protein YckC
MDSSTKYAGFWRRFVGWLIDILILTVISHWVLTLISSFISAPIPDTISLSAVFSALWPSAVALFIADFVVIALYYSILESSMLQATVGKWIAGLKITTLSGSRISFGKAFARRIYSILSIIPIFIGYFVAGFTSRKQTFHDMIAKTVVIVNKPRKGIVLVGIVIITIIAGVLSDKFLGAGFHVSINTPNGSYSNTGNTIIKRGNEVDSTLQNTIVAALDNKKAVYTRDNATEIKKYLLDTSANDPASVDQINKMSDADFLKYANLVNQITPFFTDAVVRSADTSWTFNQDMTLVRIRTSATFDKDQKGTVYIDMEYVNGKWY